MRQSPRRCQKILLCFSYGVRDFTLGCERGRLRETIALNLISSSGIRNPFGTIYLGILIMTFTEKKESYLILF